MASNVTNVCTSSATGGQIPLSLLAPRTGGIGGTGDRLSPTGKVTTGMEPSSQPLCSQQRHFPGTQAEKQPQKLLLAVPRVKGACGIKGKLIGKSLVVETKPAQAPQPHGWLYLSGTDLGSAAPRAGTGATGTATPAPRHPLPPVPAAPRLRRAGN